MPTRLVHLVIDAHEPPRLADYQYPDPAAQTLVFVPVTDPKRGKNRVHLDLATTSTEHQAAEVERDPEGNEFCVLIPR